MKVSFELRMVRPNPGIWKLSLGSLYIRLQEELEQVQNRAARFVNRRVV